MPRGEFLDWQLPNPNGLPVLVAWRQDFHNPLTPDHFGGGACSLPHHKQHAGASTTSITPRGEAQLQSVRDKLPLRSDPVRPLTNLDLIRLYSAPPRCFDASAPSCAPASNGEVALASSVPFRLQTRPIPSPRSPNTVHGSHNERKTRTFAPFLCQKLAFGFRIPIDSWPRHLSDCSYSHFPHLGSFSRSTLTASPKEVFANFEFASALKGN